MLATLLLARILGVDEFGTFSFLFASGVLVASILGGPFSTLFVRFGPSSIENSRQAGVLWFGLMALAALSLATVTGVWALSSMAQHVAHLHQPSIRLLGLYAGLSLISQGCTGLFLAHRRYAANSSAQMLGAAVWLGLGPWMSHLGGRDSAFLALVAAMGIQVTYVLLLVFGWGDRLSWPGLSAVWSARSQARSFLVPAFLAGIVNSPMVWLAQAILLAISGTAAVGIFAAASQVRGIVILIPSALAPLMLESLASLAPLGKVHYESRYSQLLRGALVGSTAACLMLMLAVPTWLPIILGSDFAPAIPVLQILLLSVMLQSVGMAAGQAFIVEARQWRLLVLNIATLVLLAISLSALVPLYDARGAAAAFALTYALYIVMLLIARAPRNALHLAGHLTMSILMLVVAGLLAPETTPSVALLAAVTFGVAWLGISYGGVVLDQHGRQHWRSLWKRNL